MTAIIVIIIAVKASENRNISLAGVPTTYFEACLEQQRPVVGPFIFVYFYAQYGRVFGMIQVMREDIPAEVRQVAKTLRDAGFDAYLVGGCTRDLMLCRAPKDWDLTTNAHPDQIVALFENS